ncbi:hypothetical protein TURU_030870 [Turdus rufiventris]|nr:hypothetical protein TURU_030870 [Turdus rufiventris]
MAEPGAGAAAEPGDGWMAELEDAGDGWMAEPEEPGDGCSEEPWGGWTAERRRLCVPGGRWLAAVLPLLLLLLLLAVPPPCSGQSSLQSPQNVQVHAVNTNFTLSWEHSDSEPNVTFSAQLR